MSETTSAMPHGLDTQIFVNYPDIVDLTQLGEMLSISRTTCYRLIKSKQIQSLQIGRKYLIPKGSILNFVAGRIS